MDKSPESVIHVFCYPRPRLLRSLLPRVVNLWSKSSTALEYIAKSHSKNKSKLIKSISEDHGHLLQIFLKESKGESWIDQITQAIELDYTLIPSNLHFEHKLQHKKNADAPPTFNEIELLRLSYQSEFAKTMSSITNRQLGKGLKVEVVDKTKNTVEIMDDETCSILHINSDQTLKIIHRKEVSADQIAPIEAFLELWKARVLATPKSDRPKTEIN